MKLLIEISDDFQKHFVQDKFQDSFMRICGDIKEKFATIGLCGNYEVELVEELKKSFASAKRIGEFDVREKRIKNHFGDSV